MEAIDNEGRVDFWSLIRGCGYLAYVAFDILWLGGRDLRHLPLNQRERSLERLIPVTTRTLLLDLPSKSRDANCSRRLPAGPGRRRSLG